MVYICDPEKNVTCKKRDCYVNGGECCLTLKDTCALELDGKKLTTKNLNAEVYDWIKKHKKKK